MRPLIGLAPLAAAHDRAISAFSGKSQVCRRYAIRKPDAVLGPVEVA